MLSRLALILIVPLLSLESQAADVPPQPPTPTGQSKVQWHHPAGLVTAESVAEIKDKLAEMKSSYLEL